MNGIKEVCKCGHDIATHFQDLTTGKRGACLGMHCDNCKRYRDPSEPKTVPPPAPWSPPYRRFPY